MWSIAFWNVLLSVQGQSLARYLMLTAYKIFKFLVIQVSLTRSTHGLLGMTRFLTGLLSR